MRVYVDAMPATLSRAMHRVAEQLRKHAPSEVQIVRRVEEADLQVLHVIGMNGMDRVTTPKLAVIQYCLKSANGTSEEWTALWRKAQLVWSYYDIAMPSGVRFYHAPLGVDGEQFWLGVDERPIGVVTSGYVAGPHAEAIEEVAQAAVQEGLSVAHLGPRPVEMAHRLERSWQSFVDLPDNSLTALYQQSRWVSGLRYVEGFELPALEGLACGARPIVFDREDMHWYRGHAMFVREQSGPDLVEELRHVLAHPPPPVTVAERDDVVRRFNWQSIAQGFWRELL